MFSNIKNRDKLFTNGALDIPIGGARTVRESGHNFNRK
jgi:hypothetical protein